MGGVLAQGYQQSLGVGSYSPATLWRRNETNDHGFGVCSEGDATCSTAGGDVNELSQLVNNEAIMLTIPAGFTLASLWVSSLDTAGTNGAEAGLLYWGNSFAGDVAAFIAAAAGSQGFAAGIFAGGAVEGDLLGVYAAIPRTFSNYLFMPNGSVGNNNDYLVWGGDLTKPISVPEPASLALFATGLFGLFAARRRRT